MASSIQPDGSTSLVLHRAYSEISNDVAQVAKDSDHDEQRDNYPKNLPSGHAVMLLPFSSPAALPAAEPQSCKSLEDGLLDLETGRAMQSFNTALCALPAGIVCMY
jgi:hypothetical protein